MRKPLLHFAILMLAALLMSGCAKPQPESIQTHQKSAEVGDPTLTEMDSGFLFLAAQNALKDGDINMAIQLLGALAEKEPASIEPQLQLIGLLLQSGRIEEGEQRISSLMNHAELSDSQITELKLARIRLMLARNRVNEALSELDNFLKTRPAHIEGRDLQVRALSSQHRYSEALDAIAQAIAADELPEFRLLQAQVHIAQGQFAAAKTSLLRLVKLDPNHETGTLMLASLYAKENQAAKAEMLLRRFLEQQGESLNIKHALGKLLVQQNKLNDAIAIYQELAGRTGEASEILQSLGMLYLQTDAYDEAEKLFRTLLAKRPDDTSRFYLASALEAKQQNDEAHKLYESISDESPVYTDAQIRLAAMDYANDAYDLAEKRLKKLLLNQPDSMQVHLTLSAVRIAQKRYQELLDETAPLMQMALIHPQILFNRAVALEHFKRYNEVESTLERLLKDHPKHAESLNFLGYTYAIQGIKLEKAEQLILRALQVKQGDGYYLDSLAWVYFKRGDYAKAMQTQKQALASVKTDPVMFEHYGDMLWRSGDHKAARKAWQQSIEMKIAEPEKVKEKIINGLP